MRTINARAASRASCWSSRTRAWRLIWPSHAYVLETGRVVVSGAADDIRKDETVRRSYLGY